MAGDDETKVFHTIDKFKAGVAEDHPVDMISEFLREHNTLVKVEGWVPLRMQVDRTIPGPDRKNVYISLMLTVKGVLSDINMPEYLLCPHCLECVPVNPSHLDRIKHDNGYLSEAFGEVYCLECDRGEMTKLIYDHDGWRLEPLKK